MIEQIITKLSHIRVVPVVEINNIEHAAPLAHALVENGLPVAEVTFRSDIAAQAIAKMRKAEPGLLLAAGTVLTNDQVDQSIDAGVDFIVSPGLNPRTVNYCLDNNIPIIPGINNPSQIEQALDLGINTVKFFPAEATGGTSFLQAILAPYRQIKVMPTGGINADNIVDYLNIPAVFTCGASWIVDKKLLNNGDFNQLGKLISSVQQLVKI